jgi:hypothetical protein
MMCIFNTHQYYLSLNVVHLVEAATVVYRAGSVAVGTFANHL